MQQPEATSTFDRFFLLLIYSFNAIGKYFIPLNISQRYLKFGYQAVRVNTVGSSGPERLHWLWIKSTWTFSGTRRVHLGYSHMGKDLPDIICCCIMVAILIKDYKIIPERQTASLMKSCLHIPLRPSSESDVGADHASAGLHQNRKTKKMEQRRNSNISFILCLVSTLLDR